MVNAASIASLVVLNNVIGPINLIVCSLCLMLLFFETAFGICIGCKLYNLFNKEKARLCPGGVCEVAPATGFGVKTGFGVNVAQITIVALFAVLVGGIGQWVYSTGSQSQPIARQASASTPTIAFIDPAEAERCRVPDFAKALGHEEKWKLHNNCK